jgi:hypothetical protein
MHITPEERDALGALLEADVLSLGYDFSTERDRLMDDCARRYEVQNTAVAVFERLEASSTATSAELEHLRSNAFMHAGAF